MSARLKLLGLNLLALCCCIVPPASTTMYFFPIWIDKGVAAKVSGLSVLILVICALPFWRVLRENFKNPSVKTIWFIGLLLFWLIRPIVDEMIVICAVGFLSNCIGSIVFKLRDRYKESNKL